VNPRTRFLLASAAGAAVTATALQPVDRFGPGAGPAFVVGSPVAELPLHVAGANAGLALLLARSGGWRGLRGLAGMGLTAASLAGLWRLQRDAEASGQVLEDALVAALGPDYRDRIAEPFAPPPASDLTRRRVLVPDLRTRRRYVAAAGRDVSYGEAGRRNLLDVWRRPDLAPDAGAPVLLQVHGGAWVAGQKEGQAHPLMAHLASRGWVCVTINYRLSPRSTWPDHIVDVKRAIAWVRDHTAELGGDPAFLAITGGSAGGHLAALAALTPGDPAFQPGFEDADTSVVAAAPFYGVYDFTDRHGVANRNLDRLLAENVLKTRLADDREHWEAASPMSRVGPDAPPFFVVHGCNDTIVPVEQAREFAALLRAASRRPVAYAELPRAQHAFDVLPSVRTRHTVQAVERFLAVVRSERGGATPAEAVADAAPSPAAQADAGAGAG
jgi:acetyl esterase/lipase